MALTTLSDQEKMVALAHVAESAGRYDDMVDYVRQRVEMGGALSAQERDLLSAAFKGSLSVRRHAIHMATNIHEQEVSAGRNKQAILAAGYRTKVEVELQRICAEAVALLKAGLLPKAETGEAKTFYLKMQGDYCRYSAEVSTGQAREQAMTDASVAYAAAIQEAEKHLLTTHPVRLGLSLNLSVFQHEVLGDTAKALSTAKAAYESAIIEIDHLPEEAHEDAAATLQLLFDNLSLWSSETDAQQPGLG